MGPFHVFVERSVRGETSMHQRSTCAVDGDGGSYVEEAPLELAYTEQLPDIADALSRERQLKHWSAQRHAPGNVIHHQCDRILRTIHRFD